jgi:hypothetical protein
MTGRALLDPQAATHLCKLLGMLGSAHDGEVAAAGRKAHQHVRRLGLTWADVIAKPPPPWQHMANVCRDRMHELSDREAQFILSAARWCRPPTEKQHKWLADIYARIGGRAAAA